MKPLVCNIDAKGKRVRFVMGAAEIIGAVLLAAVWAWPSNDWRRWMVAGVLFLFGAFAIFEARAGWCIVRAMGFKTKV